MHVPGIILLYVCLEDLLMLVAPAPHDPYKTSTYMDIPNFNALGMLYILP
jgi:hypothetical protein